MTVSGIDYHTIGSAHLNDPSTAHKDSIPKDSLVFHATGAVGGFGTLDFDSEGNLVVTHYDGDGTKLYSAPGRAPRHSSCRESAFVCVFSSLYSELVRYLN